MQGKTRRLFFALWPDETSRERLARLARKTARRRGKRVPDENLHITLVFLGSVSAVQAACLVRATEDVRGEPFSLRLDRVGHWARPRVLWIGPSQVPDALLSLVRDLNDAARACGLATDPRPYNPHLTVARKVSAGREAEVDPVEWRVESFSLVESVTDPQGARYQVLRTWTLGR